MGQQKCGSVLLLRSAQRQAEQGTERQRGCDRQIRVLRLATPANACLSAPALNRLGREPHRKAAAGT